MPVINEKNKFSNGVFVHRGYCNSRDDFAEVRIPLCVLGFGGIVLRKFVPNTGQHFAAAFKTLQPTNAAHLPTPPHTLRGSGFIGRHFCVEIRQ